MDDYLDGKDLARNGNFTTDQKNSNIEILNFKDNISKFLKKLFITAYETDKLIQTIIDTKSTSL